MTTMKYIADHINNDKIYNQKRKYKVVMVPRKLHVCEMILENEGVYGDIDILELNLDLIPLDRDLLSLEMPDFFRTFYLDSDYVWIHTVAKSLIGLQAFTGMIPNIYCIGKGAKMVYDLMDTILGEKMVEPEYSRNEIGSLFIIDRNVDFVTPLCSQLTYEGLLDETFGISSGFIEFGKEVSGKDQTTKLLLTSQDEIFEEVRNRHVSNVFGYLSTKAKSLQTDFDKRHGFTSVGDMKNFVANELRNLKQQKSVLAQHIGACEVILNRKTKGDFEEYLQTEHSLLEGSGMRENLNYIEELIYKQHSLIQTLKLICLMSLTQDGIPSRDYKSLKTQYLQSHGFEHMLTFYNLKRLGILKGQESQLPQQQGGTPLNKVTSGVASITSRSSYKNLCKRLNLIPKSDEINLKSPTDMSYVFSGAYSPISCKLIDQVLNKEGFLGMDDITKHLPGPTFSKVRLKQSRAKGSSQSFKTADPPCLKVVLVYFLGGCTFSEISALRIQILGSNYCNDKWKHIPRISDGETAKLKFSKITLPLEKKISRLSKNVLH
ncbi:hypothetical protein KUTeg_018460 [Tegillarca granosa]|uniref:Vacuolar protein sorting-associated protein 33B n=1 Tax=Tegillarca granosa TaxID=220873 RepID=A0ABQ9ELT2_TEGGR|nr:hypothetical protein KUTeg_018460 [Tegillarca granosa]